MDIQLKLNKDFERTLDSLRVKYGEDFEYINGIHPSQLDYSEFLDKFVKNNTLADTTIDPNANANHRDIRSFITEKGKSSDKLFGLNKVFIEIKKKLNAKRKELSYDNPFYMLIRLEESTDDVFRSSTCIFHIAEGNNFTGIECIFIAL